MPWGRSGDQNNDKVTELQTQVDALKTENERLKGFETELSTTKSTLVEQQGALTEMKQALAQLQNRQPSAVTPKTDNTPKERTSFLVDEDTAFGERFNESVGPIATATIANAGRLARMVVENQINANGRDRFLLNKYRNEYEAMVAQLTPVQQTMEGAYQNCFKIVKADHINEMLDSVSKGNDFFTESSSGPAAPTAKKNETLTAEESAMAKKFGISDADYLQSKNQIQFVNA